MNWEVIWDHRNLLLSGLWFTVSLTLVTIVTSTVLGFLVSLLRNARIPVLNLVLKGYIELFRGSPLLIQILFVYFGATALRLPGMSAFLAVAVAITLYHGAYAAEVFRAGFESVPVGQREAGRSLGLPRRDITRFVVLPQAMRVSLAPLFGLFITLVKNTSLASVIGYADLVRQGQGIIERFWNPFGVFLVVAALYFVICYPMSLIARALEKRTVKS